MEEGLIGIAVCPKADWIRRALPMAVEVLEIKTSFAGVKPLQSVVWMRSTGISHNRSSVIDDIVCRSIPGRIAPTGHGQNT
jgi:hypothetical protein